MCVCVCVCVCVDGRRKWSVVRLNGVTGYASSLHSLEVVTCNKSKSHDQSGCYVSSLEFISDSVRITLFGSTGSSRLYYEFVTLLVGEKLCHANNE